MKALQKVAYSEGLVEIHGVPIPDLQSGNGIKALFIPKK